MVVGNGRGDVVEAALLDMGGSQGSVRTRPELIRLWRLQARKILSGFGWWALRPGSGKLALSCFCALAAAQWAQAAKFVLGYSKPTQVSPCLTPTCLWRDVRERIFALLKGLDSCHCFFRVIARAGSPDTCWAPFGLTPCAKPSSALEARLGHARVLVSSLLSPVGTQTWAAPGPLLCCLWSVLLSPSCNEVTFLETGDTRHLNASNKLVIIGTRDENIEYCIGIQRLEKWNKHRNFLLKWPIGPML